MKRFSQWLSLLLLITVPTSCATLLHPERKGNNRAPLDTLPLVLDILLFIPGIIPGVVALVVDFGTGAIYLRKEGNDKPLLAGVPAAERSDGSVPLTVKVVDSDDRVVRYEKVVLQPPKAGERKPILVRMNGEPLRAGDGDGLRLEVASGKRQAVVMQSL